MERRKYLISPRARGIITRQLAIDRPWKGRRQGIKIELRLRQQADFEGRRIEWKARIAGIWTTGKAGTVWDAIQQIETQAAQNR